MFYFSNPPIKDWGNGQENYLLDSNEGVIVVEVLKEKIVAVEIVNRDEIREKLLVLLPENFYNEQLTTNN